MERSSLYCFVLLVAVAVATAERSAPKLAHEVPTDWTEPEYSALVEQAAHARGIHHTVHAGHGMVTYISPARRHIDGIVLAPPAVLDVHDTRAPLLLHDPLDMELPYYDDPHHHHDRHGHAHDPTHHHIDVHAHGSHAHVHGHVHGDNHHHYSAAEYYDAVRAHDTPVVVSGPIMAGALSYPGAPGGLDYAPYTGYGMPKATTPTYSYAHYSDGSVHRKRHNHDYHPPIGLLHP